MPPFIHVKPLLTQEKPAWQEPNVKLKASKQHLNQCNVTAATSNIYPVSRVETRKEIWTKRENSQQHKKEKTMKD